MSVLGKTRGRRQYVRAFDYEEARRRHANGESVSDLAREYGVSSDRVRQVVFPEVGRRADERKAAYRYVCPDCGERIATRKNARCRPCSVVRMRVSVREDTLQCVTCQQWKPDEDFPSNRSEEHRRGRHTSCRSCQTINKRAYRKRKGSS
jgi:predicted RNA-binding Zn-ribbon protein involved in translation (DUF1610 family)